MDAITPVIRSAEAHFPPEAEARIVRLATTTACRDLVVRKSQTYATRECHSADASIHPCL